MSDTRIREPFNWPRLVVYVALQAASGVLYVALTVADACRGIVARVKEARR